MAIEDIRLAPIVRDSPTSTPTIRALLELAEERAKCARLEKEFQRVKTEAEIFAEAKGRAEDEVREIKQLLGAREKEIGRKDARIRQLEKDMSEMQKKVGWVGRGMGSNS